MDQKTPGARGFRVVLISMLLVTLPACTFSRATMINSDPSGAEVIYKTQLKGMTPAAVRMSCVGFQGGDDPMAGFGDTVVELRKPGYRPMKAVIDGHWQWNNVLFGGIVGILLWGKCPGESYMYRLQAGSAELEGKTTLTVNAMPEPLGVFVDGQPVTLKQRLVLDRRREHDVTITNSSGRVLNRGTLRLEPGTDHVTSLVFLAATRGSRRSPEPGERGRPPAGLFVSDPM